MKIIEAGSDRAGRQLKDIDVTSCVIVSIDSDSKQAKDAVRPTVATYLAGFPNIARESTMSESELSRIRAAFSSGGAAEASRHITDEIVDELTCSGTPDECRACIAERRAAGVAMPILFIVAGDVDMAISELASA
jgi:5,10-methylenetetrahydromethanopterin reductase